MIDHRRRLLPQDPLDPIDPEIERILAMSDADLLAEEERDGVDVLQVAADGRAMFERAVRLMNVRETADALEVDHEVAALKRLVGHP